MADAGNTAVLSSSTTPSGTVADDVGDSIEPPAVQTNVAGTLTDIESMIDGGATTADGTVIPKEVIRNTACIIFGDFAATFIAYTVVTNIGIFGKDFLHLDLRDVEEWNLIVVGIDAVFFLLAGCFTDWYGGSYAAMHIYGIVCFLGSCILPLLTFNWSVFGPAYGIPVTGRRVLFYLARITIGLGFSGIYVTAPPFAARQLEAYGKASVQSCFHYIYTVVQFAPLIVLTSISFIQLNVSFFVGYLVILTVNVLTMVFFKYARSIFIQGIPDKGKKTALVLKTAAQAVKTKVTTRTSCCSSNCCPNLWSSIQTTDDESVELLGKGALTDSLPTVDAAETEDTHATTVDPLGSTAVDISRTNGSSPTPAVYGTLELDIAGVTGHPPETVRRALWVCYAIVLLSCEFPYSIVRYQVSTSFVSQAERMKPTILGQVVDSSLLQRYLPVLGITLAPLVNVYIYPYISKRFVTLTMPFRTIIGLVFATLSVLSAAIVETARLTFIDRGNFTLEDVNGQTLEVSDLSLDALIPQYFFMGVADVFIFITGLEFAFTQSPCSMQTVVTGIFLFFEATGRIAATLLVPLINIITAADPWYPPEINHGHLNLYFLVLTGISLTNLIIFCLFEKGYEIVDEQLCPDDVHTVGESTGTTTTSKTTPSGTLSANTNQSQTSTPLST
nr:solute carrier family 15 member 3-like [Lytechinus pictus]